MDASDAMESESELTELQKSQLGRPPVPPEALYQPGPLCKKEGDTLGGREFQT